MTTFSTGLRTRGRNDPLRDIVGQKLDELRRAGGFFTYNTVEGRTRADPRYRRARAASPMHQRYGDSGVIRSAIDSYRFLTPPYTGIRALRPLPVANQRQGIFKWADLMTVDEWQQMATRMRTIERSAAAKATDIEAIIADLLARVAAGQITANGTLADVYGAALRVGTA